jgi:aspartyl-tRNA synthetase
MMRTNTCNELNAGHEGKEVTLCGWVHRRRDHGNLIFIDLRDRYGLTQVVSDPAVSEELHAQFDKLRPEFVIQVKGSVRKRPDGMTNKNMESGGIEVLCAEMNVLNESIVPPFEIDQDKEVSEEMRLKFRYLDLRRERMKTNMVLRHKLIKRIRDLMDERGFLEIETPIMIKGTPEGSREYMVPSRLYPGNFYVLPQSPQQLKQLLMVAGFDRYFQIARCFRDEDQRGDRQPEFTQFDVEMSFVNEEDVMNVNEEIMIKLTEELALNKKIMFRPFKRITWQRAMDEYGVDKPDMRFEMPITDLTDELKSCGFKVFSDAVGSGGKIRALRVEGGASYTRREIDELTETARAYGGKGLAYMQFTEAEIKSPILKFLNEREVGIIKDKTGAKTGDIVFFGADKFETVCAVMGQVRLVCGDKAGLRNPDVFAFCWVTDWPLFSWNEDDQRLNAEHHPFTAPFDEDVGLLDSSPESVRAKAYDMVLNGSEIGGGSIRIHDRNLQSKIFDILKISNEDAERRFGHLLKAFEYGAPPHGGIALGLDRVVMIFRDEPNIREVIAFPKDQKARDLLLNSPSPLPDEQVAEAHIAIKIPKT